MLAREVVEALELEVSRLSGELVALGRVMDRLGVPWPAGAPVLPGETVGAPAEPARPRRSHPSRPGARQAAVLEVLGAATDGPLTIPEVAAAMGSGESYLYRALPKLREQGRVVAYNDDGTEVLEGEELPPRPRWGVA
jgi:hypothetical protein